MEGSSNINFDARGREILSQVPVAFNVPIQKRISTLDFHRQRILEERERLRALFEQMKEDEELETFAEANDFRVDDPLDPEALDSDFQLDDDIEDPSSVLAEQEYRTLASQSGKGSSEEVKSEE